MGVRVLSSWGGGVRSYSRKVPQQAWTQADPGALCGTVTCGYVLWWTGCHWMACKRSGVRIPIAPLSQVFPGQSLADGGPVSAARIHAGQTGGVAVVFAQVTVPLSSTAIACVSSKRADRATQFSWLPAFLQFRQGLVAEPVRTSSSLTSGGSHAGSTPRPARRLFALSYATVQMLVRRPSAGVADCPTLAVAALQGHAFLAVPARRRSGGMALTLTAPAEDCWRPRSCRERLPGTHQPVSD